MNTDMRFARIQPPIYEHNGFNDSVAEGNTVPVYYTEIEEVAPDGLVHFGQTCETNSIVSGERTSGIYQEISESHMDVPQASDYEEVLNMNTSYNYPCLWDGMAEEYICDLRPRVVNQKDNVNEKDNPSHNNIAVSESPSINSMNENENVKLSSIAKAAETALMDEDIHEGRNGMVTMENETYADQPSNIVKAAEGIVQMDNDACIYESDSVVKVAVEADLLDKPISVMKSADEIDLMDNETYESGGGMVAIENEAHEEEPISVAKVAVEFDLLDNDIYESDGGMVGIENEAHKDKPISVVKSADETDPMDNETY